MIRNYQGAVRAEAVARPGQCHPEQDFQNGTQEESRNPGPREMPHRIITLPGPHVLRTASVLHAENGGT